VAVDFNNAISSRDLTRLGELMTEDHTLVTGNEDPVEGKEACLLAWKQFFELLPEYRNVFERVWSTGEVVRMCGRSVSTDERLNGPAIWKAIVEGNRVREWYVDGDTPEGRRRLGHDSSEG
jgi:hypothetical protein